MSAQIPCRRESDFAEPTGESNMSSAKRDSSGDSEEGEIKDGSASIGALAGSLDVLTNIDCYFVVEQPPITSGIPASVFDMHVPFSNALRAAVVPVTTHDYDAFILKVERLCPKLLIPETGTPFDSVQGFPPLNKTEITGENESDELFEVSLTGNISVGRMNCPKTAEREGFWANAQYDRYKAHGGELFVFYGDIPANTNLDLLEFHDDQALRDMLNTLEEKTEDELLPEAPLFGTEPASFTERRKKATPNKVPQQSCISAREAIQEKYITFTRMCDEYDRRFMVAKLTAKRTGWYFTPNGGTTYISQMEIYDSGWGMRPVGRTSN
ncbi:hypothetical protein FOL46_002999 [Perkinsus olseni]|uniref:Uncharacterized protein n=1 Tax=Perkinsus olseni TaxID=32597 RepID=A0A7J6M625_PEROL|nr:hypothetical protein FOL46_002999 [Perkinsus olseni]